MKAAVYALYAVAIAAAILCGRLRAKHYGIALTLAFVIAMETLRRWLDDGQAHWQLRGLYIMEPLAVAGLAMNCLGGMSARTINIAVVLGACGSIGAAANVPNPVGVYRAAHLSVLAAGLAAILARVPMGRRDEASDAPKSLDVTDYCTIALVAQWGAGDPIAAYLHNDPWAEHRFVQRLAVAVLAALILLQGGYLWRQRTRSSASA